jgi:hypothetical protein
MSVVLVRRLEAATQAEHNQIGAKIVGRVTCPDLARNQSQMDRVYCVSAGRGCAKNVSMRIDASDQKRFVGGDKLNDFARGRSETGASEKSEDS